MPDPIDTEVAAALVRDLLALREHPGATPAAQAAALLRLFPRVHLRDGFVLDYLSETTDTGVALPDRPFARPADDDTWLPLFDDEPAREELVEALYQYLEHEASACGLFEYVLFVLDLWAPGTSGHDAGWLDSTPIVDDAGFDACLAAASTVVDVKRPERVAPHAEPAEDGGGTVRFLVHSTTGRSRIYVLEAEVGGDGFVAPEAGEIVADLGAGLVF